VHAWNGGPWDQGTRYHGAIYDRLQSEPLAWQPRPFDVPVQLLGVGGCGCAQGTGANEAAPEITLPRVALAVGIATLVVWGALKLVKKEA
jgi:hypothetical protein